MIINYNCRDLVSSVPFFSNADPNFVTAVITRLQYEFFLPDDIIVHEGTLGDRMYFIQEGLVEIFMEAKEPDGEKTVITCLGDGSYFGGSSSLCADKFVSFLTWDFEPSTTGKFKTSIYLITITLRAPRDRVCW